MIEVLLLSGFVLGAGQQMSYSAVPFFGPVLRGNPISNPLTGEIFQASEFLPRHLDNALAFVGL